MDKLRKETIKRIMDKFDKKFGEFGYKNDKGIFIDLDFKDFFEKEISKLFKRR